MREPIAVLLLPRRLEELEQHEALAALLQGEGVLALEPGRLPPMKGRRLRGQARRLLRRLPGRPAVIVVFGEREQPLGEELASRVMGCEVIATRETEGLRARFRAKGIDA